MRPKNSSGFIKLILLIVAAVLILSYFGVNLREIAESETGKENISFLKGVLLQIWNFILSVWERFLEQPVMYFWNDIFLKYVWSFVVDSLDKIRK